MDKNNKLCTHGGARAGAGRPRTGSKAIQFKAPKDMAEYIEQQPNKAAYIKACIERDMRERTKAIPNSIDLEHASAILSFVDVSVAAGTPIGTDAAEYGERTDLISFFPAAKTAVVVEGRSMEDADIHSGDVLLIDPEAHAVEEHHIALCELNGSYTVKHVRRESDSTYLLLPRNDSYTPIRVTPDDRFYIRGRVIGVMKHL